MMNPFPMPQFPCLQSESGLSGFCGLKWDERGGKGLGNEGGQRGKGRRRGGARRGECSPWSTIHEGAGASADTDRLLRKPGSSEHSPHCQPGIGGRVLSNGPTTGGTHGQNISHVLLRLSRGLGVWKQLLVRVGFDLGWEWGTSLGQGVQAQEGADSL